MLEPIAGNPPNDFTFVIDGGAKKIDAVQLTMDLGTVKIPLISFTVEEAFDPDPLDLNFTVVETDNDDDTSSDSFTIDLDVA